MQTGTAMEKAEKCHWNSRTFPQYDCTFTHTAAAQTFYKSICSWNMRLSSISAHKWNMHGEQNVAGFHFQQTHQFCAQRPNVILQMKDEPKRLSLTRSNVPIMSTLLPSKCPPFVARNCCARHLIGLVSKCRVFHSPNWMRHRTQSENVSTTNFRVMYRYSPAGRSCCLK